MYECGMEALGQLEASKGKSNPNAIHGRDGFQFRAIWPNSMLFVMISAVSLHNLPYLIKSSPNRFGRSSVCRSLITHACVIGHWKIFRRKEAVINFKIDSQLPQTETSSNSVFNWSKKNNTTCKLVGKMEGREEVKVTLAHAQVTLGTVHPWKWILSKRTYQALSELKFRILRFIMLGRNGPDGGKLSHSEVCSERAV
jgi:hypothetical protein